MSQPDVSSSDSPKDGTVVTFYSYKGGVGRSMALANVAALLAKRERKVLVIDWDLEAPGIEKYFDAERRDKSETGPSLEARRRVTPGLVDLVGSVADGKEIDWRSCLLTAEPFPRRPVSILSAGRDADDYAERLRALNWDRLFEEHNFGETLERWRNEWRDEYDFVLVDSRTGITDIGGICTIHLPDVLVAMFTANKQSLQGIKRVMQDARTAQQALPVDRARLSLVPVAARDESLTEHERAREWRETFARELGEFYEGWLPREMSPRDAIDQLKIPYKAYWSFGERLPAVVEGTNDPASIGHAYDVLAGLVERNLKWDRAIEAETRAEAARSEARAAVAAAEKAEALAKQSEALAAEKAEALAKQSEALARQSDALAKQNEVLAKETEEREKRAGRVWRITALAVSIVAIFGTVIYKRHAESLQEQQAERLRQQVEQDRRTARLSTLKVAAAASDDPLEALLVLAEAGKEQPAGAKPPEDVARMAARPVPSAVLPAIRPGATFALSPDGKTVALASSAGVELVHADGRRRPILLRPELRSSELLTFNRRGDKLLVVGNGVATTLSLNGELRGGGARLDSSVVEICAGEETAGVLLADRRLQAWSYTGAAQSVFQIAGISRDCSAFVSPWPKFQAVGRLVLGPSGFQPSVIGKHTFDYCAGIQEWATNRYVLRRCRAQHANLTVLPLPAKDEAAPIELPDTAADEVLALSWQGDTVLTTGDGGTRVWNLASARSDRLEGDGQPRPIAAGDIDETGTVVVTATRNGQFRVWTGPFGKQHAPATWGELVATARKDTSACLLPAQRTQLLLESPPSAREEYERCARQKGIPALSDSELDQDASVASTSRPERPSISPDDLARIAGYRPGRMTKLTRLPTSDSKGASAASVGADNPDHLDGRANTGSKIVASQLLEEGSVLGVDLSHQTTVTNWSALRAAHVEFVYMKATQGANFVDSKFSEWWTAARQGGLLRGAYHVYRPNVDPSAQAQFFRSQVRIADGDLPPVLVIEKVEPGPKGAASILKLVEETERLFGVRPMLYAGRALRDLGVDDLLANSPLWLPQYNNSEPVVPAGSKGWSIWQFTVMGTLPGVEGQVDLNIFKGTRPDLDAFIAASTAEAKKRMADRR